MQKFKRDSVVELAPVIQAIKSNDTKLTVNGQRCGVTSLRLMTFARQGTTCSCCKLKASFFAVERDYSAERDDRPFHLNLYGIIDGKEILFTHDHTVARSLGGSDNLNNTTTMCSPCNQLKSIAERAEHATNKKLGIQPKKIKA